MYFFRLKKLLAELQTDPANDGRTFKYFFVLTAMITAQFIYNVARPSYFSFGLICLFTAVSLIKLVGIIICYLVNGGKNGKFFFHRIFPLGWVLLLRVYIPLAILLFLVVITVLNIMGINLASLPPEQISIINFIEALIAMIVYWWRMVINIKILAKV